MCNKLVLCVFFALLSINVKASLLYSSTFSDNGNKVTEVRDFGDGSSQTWEWLDLTITNGITYGGVVDDLSDGFLDGSALTASNASMGAMADIGELAISDQSGWQTVSVRGITDLFYAYFGLDFDFDIDTDTYLSYDFGLEQPYINESPQVESFLQIFGDTWVEHLWEDWDRLSLYGHGLLSGYTSDVLFDGKRLRSSVYDLDYNASDEIRIHGDVIIEPRPARGTWLVRQVGDDAAEVPEPSSIILLVTALLGLMLNRSRLI